MENPLSGLSPVQLLDGVSVLSALYALDLATTDRYDVKIQLLTNSFTDTRMRAMFREAKEQLDQTQEMFSSQRKGLQRSSCAFLPSEKAREIKMRNLTTIMGSGDVPLYFMSHDGNPDYTKDTVVGTTPRKRLFEEKDSLNSTPVTLSRTQKEELISRLQTELTYDTFSDEEITLASKVLDAITLEKQQMVHSKYSLSAERGALDTIFRLVVLYVLKNCQGSDLTPYQKNGRWNWWVPSPRQPNSIYTLEVLTGTFISQVLSVQKTSAWEYMIYYDQEVPKFEWLLDLYLPQETKRAHVLDFKNLLTGRLECTLSGQERILKTLNSDRDPGRQTIESSFDFYKSQLRNLYPTGCSYQSVIPGIHMVDFSRPEGDDTPVVGHLGTTSSRNTGHPTNPDKKRARNDPGKTGQSFPDEGNDSGSEDESSSPTRKKSSDMVDERVLNPIVALLEHLVERGFSKKPSPSKKVEVKYSRWRDTMCPAMKKGEICRQGVACTANHGKFFGGESNPCLWKDCSFQFSPRGCKCWHPPPAVKIDPPNESD